MLALVHQEALYFLNTFMAVGKSRKGWTVLPYIGRIWNFWGIWREGMGGQMENAKGKRKQWDK